VLTPFQDRITQAEVGRKRCQPTVDEYQLAGLLRSLKTDGSAFKFGLRRAPWPSGRPAY